MKRKFVVEYMLGAEEKMSNTNQSGKNESYAVEYEQANEWWRCLSAMRRHDIFLFTGVQGGVLTIIGNNLLSMSPRDIVLSIIAFVVSLIGLNNERRLYSYLQGFRARAIEIERLVGMSLIQSGTQQVGKTRATVSNTIAFSAFYALMATGWIVIWAINLFGIDAPTRIP
jgi:hypothetical protein